jgi:creatinine amidohydrolase/Fe(II)-dependent formamide hydrolase-like protein/ribosomal protein S18 acetylase RimI-like enzyme
MADDRVLDVNSTSFDWQRHPGDIAVLPIGSCEQHSHHLPLSTDIVQAEHYARHLARALDAALLPALPVSSSLEHTGFRGSFSLRPTTIIAVVEDLAAELERQGFRRLVVVNGHGGNFILNPAIRHFNRQSRSLRVLLVNAWEHADPALRPTGEIHAGESETSVMLAIAPQLVGEHRVDLFPAQVEPDVRQSDLTQFGVGFFSPEGIWGAPSRATVELGERLVASTKAGMVAHVKRRLEWLDRSERYEGLGPIVERPMTAGDIAAGLHLSRAAGWNDTRQDWELCLAQQPDGARCLVRNGQVVGTVLGVDYQGQFGWIGMLLVEPAFRRHGLGTRLLRLAMERLAQCETIKLDATPAGREACLAMGFRDEQRLLRMEAVAGNGRAVPDLPVAPMGEAHLPAVLALDAEVFGADRSRSLRACREAAPALAYVCQEGGAVQGYCFGRHGETHERLGPLVARRREVAQALLGTALGRFAGRRLLLEAPLHDGGWMEWLEALGFREQGLGTRMVKGPNRHPGRPELLYAMLGPELG